MECVHVVLPHVHRVCGVCVCVCGVGGGVGMCGVGMCGVGVVGVGVCMCVL